MSKETILVIDDSSEIRALLEMILPFGGYETLSAGTGWEGLGLAFGAKPDAILVDLELPDIGGLKILEQLNREHITIPTIMMTGYGSEGVAARALRLGAVGYLIKPFTTEEVLTTVEKALSVARLHRERTQLSGLVDAYSRELRALGALSQAMINGIDLETLLQRIVEAASYITRAERCMLSLTDEASDGFRIVARRGKKGFGRSAFSAAAGDERLWPVLGEGLAVRLDAASDAAIEIQTGDQVQALVQVPLQTRNGIAGLLSIDRQGSEMPFGEHDEQVLSILASYAVMALEKDNQGLTSGRS